MQPRISLITFGVRDFEKSVRFYANVLGLPLSSKSGGDVAFFELQGTWLGLHPRKMLAADAGVPAAGSGYRGVTLSHNLRSIKEVDAFFANLRKHKVKIVKKPTKAEWGGYNGYFADPDGNLWEVAFNPFFWVGPKG